MAQTWTSLGHGQVSDTDKDTDLDTDMDMDMDRDRLPVASIL
jgi:hypothetical protein